jgi:SAM-dependent methyltransferase
MICPLCGSVQSELFDKDKTRSFYQCGNCSLVFVPRDELITPDAEKHRYDAHENDETSSGYRDYLSGIAAQLQKYLKNGMTGLDFGSGRTKLLAELLSSEHVVDSYDVYFHPDLSFLNKKYDFIILSEVIEHLRDPVSELKKLKSILKPDGILFVKTKLVPEKSFSTWFYKRDITHVQFFSDDSFRHLSKKFGFEEASMIGEDLFLFRNQA